MATRTIGTVTGATVLMLIFQWLRTSAPDGFLAAFQATFRIAAAIPAVLVVIDLGRFGVAYVGFEIRIQPR